MSGPAQPKSGKRTRSTRRVLAQRALTASQQAVRDRSGGVCEHPRGCRELAAVFHHRAGRGWAGCHAPEWLAHLCDADHLRVHANPAESYANGMMVKRNAPVAPHVRDSAAVGDEL